MDHSNAQELEEEQIRAESASRRSWMNLQPEVLLDRVWEPVCEEQRQTLERHFFEGYSLREIGENANQTLGNVRITITAALNGFARTFSPKRTRE